jgi:hypothetical protein
MLDSYIYRTTMKLRTIILLIIGFVIIYSIALYGMIAFVYVVIIQPELNKNNHSSNSSSLLVSSQKYSNSSESLSFSYPSDWKFKDSKYITMFTSADAKSQLILSKEHAILNNFNLTVYADNVEELAQKDFTNYSRESIDITSTSGFASRKIVRNYFDKSGVKTYSVLIIVNRSNEYYSLNVTVPYSQKDTLKDSINTIISSFSLD